jgi:hypothetical protein
MRPPASSAGARRPKRRCRPPPRRQWRCRRRIDRPRRVGAERVPREPAWRGPRRRGAEARLRWLPRRLAAAFARGDRRAALAVAEPAGLPARLPAALRALLPLGLPVGLRPERLAAPALAAEALWAADVLPRVGCDSPQSCATMAGFSSVETSSVISPPRAMARNSRRMILPERVFGSASANRISSGCAMGLSCSATQLRSSCARVGESPGTEPRHTT